MKYVVAGGSGFVGKGLIASLIQKKHSVILLTRNEKASQNSGVKAVYWDGESLSDWVSELEGSEALINLSGQSVATKRWSDKRKKEIIDSRINSTRTLVSAISKLKNPPRKFINASAVGYYGDTGNDLLDEAGRQGEGFLPNLCGMWEKEAFEVKKFGVLVSCIRIGVVLEKEGGVLSRMIPPFQFFVGGPLGSGNQWMPWIHREDLVNLIQWSTEDESNMEVINAVSPDSVTMNTFCKALGKVMGRPHVFRVYSWFLKFLFGEMSTIMLWSQKIYPKNALDGGFKFSYPTISEALENILK